MIDEIFSATKLDVRKKKLLLGSRESLMYNELADALPPRSVIQATSGKDAELSCEHAG